MLSTIMIASIGSGQGKTTFTTGLLSTLKERDTHAFKCGPDYIDPMFHREIIGIPSTNLDPFFCDKAALRDVFLRNAGSVNIIEAAMGLFDGISTTKNASAYEVAETIGCPIVLLISGHGMGYSIVPLIKGFIAEDTKGLIRGVVINRISDRYYEKIKPVIERETGVRVYGHLPRVSGGELESRHLGLLLPKENHFLEKIQNISEAVRENVDIEGLIELSRESEFYIDPSELEKSKDALICETKNQNKREYVVAIAKDEAFSFFYEENIKFLESIGADIVYFSPIHDDELPKGCKSVIFYGGYPENYAKELSENYSMLLSIKKAYSDGVKILAECGGFMYLLESMNVADTEYKMAGIIKGSSYKTKGLVRFGYVHIDNDKTSIRGHEFHHFDTEGVKYSPEYSVINEGTREEYKAIVSEANLFAGFPHLYYLNCKDFIKDFLRIDE